MPDGRKNNKGTVGNNGGRPPKIDEIALIERLSPMEDIALDALKRRIEADDIQAIKLYMEYRYGKPKQDIGISGMVDLATKITFK